MFTRNPFDHHEDFLIVSRNLIHYTGTAAYVVVPEHVRVIAASAFANNRTIRSVRFPDALVSVERYAFVGCQSLERVDTGNGLITIPEGCFMGLPALTNICLGASVERIEENAFKGCAALARVERVGAGDAVDNGAPPLAGISVAESAFAGCPLLLQTARHTPAAIAADPPETTDPGVPVDMAKAGSIGTPPREHAPEPARLLEGYALIPGHVLNLRTGERIPDVDIQALGLSCRPLNALLRDSAPAPMLLTRLLRKSAEELGAIRNLGVTSVNEIASKAQRYLQDGAWRQPNAHVPAAGGDPAFRANNGRIEHIATGEVYPDAPLDVLALGNRPYNRLMYYHITTVGALLAVSRAHLEAIPYLGKKGLDDIDISLRAYLAALRNSAQESEDPAPTVEGDMPTAPVASLILTEYAFWQNVIVHTGTYRSVPDAAVTVLGLSERAAAYARRAGLERLSSLLLLSPEEVQRPAGMGKKIAQELIRKLRDYLDTCPGDYLSPPNTSGPLDCTPLHIREAYLRDPFAALRPEDFVQILPGTMDADSIFDCLRQMLASGELTIGNGSYSLQHPGYLEVLDNLVHADPDNTALARMVAVVKGRAQGQTLEEIGAPMSLTRERIRQIEAKGQRQLTHVARVVAEDRYRYLYETYLTGAPLFSDGLHQPTTLWYYLSSRYTPGAKPLDQAVGDKRLSRDTRRMVLTWLQRDHVSVDGTLIPGRRGDIEDYLLEKHCRDEMTLAGFFELYGDFVRKHGLDSEPRLIPDDSTYYTRANRLAASPIVLWKQNRRLRFYDMPGSDFGPLYEELDLKQYKDTAFSTRLLMLKHVDIMEQFDIRDEYELHNLLKKTNAGGLEGIDFKRMPMIQFGEFDRDEAVREILYTYAPVSADALAELISATYGARPESIRANWLNGISAHHHQGMYSIDNALMPYAQQQKLLAVLKDDFYFIHEILSIYRKVVPGANRNLVTPYNLKLMGFKVNASYAYRNYQSADAYFRELLSGQDFVDATAISRRMGMLPAYASCLAQLKADYAIVEHSPLHYVSAHWLASQGVTRGDLTRFCDAVAAFVGGDRFFTMQKLRGEGFVTGLDRLGFDDWFYSSLLRADERFSYLRMGSSIVLRMGPESFTPEDFVFSLIELQRDMQVERVLHLLTRVYGLRVDRYDVISRAVRAGLMYDRIDDTIRLAKAGS